MARNYSGLSPYYTSVDDTLEQYVPLPFQEMMAASNAIQQRGDAIENQKLATDSLLANIEALNTQHKSYVNQRATNFRNDSSKLLDTYGGNAADPEYIRKTKQLIMQYANDGNFRTIASANEKLKINDKISREMRAKGQLFTRPTFAGLDNNGNLVDNVGEVELVNTLDKLKSEYEIAWKSMENDNRGTITNKNNIDRLNKRVLDSVANNSPEFTKLAQAYMEQGLSKEEAVNQINSDITGLRGQYGVIKQRDDGYYNYQLAKAKFSLDAQETNMKMKLMKGQLAAMQGQSTERTVPKFVSQQDAIKGEQQNAARKDIVKEFRKHIGSDGNIKAKPKTLQSGAFGAPATQIYTTTKIGNRSLNETLNYMRTELGWKPKQGSAKGVADAYEAMIKNDNLVPTYWVPTNQATHSNLENMFKNDFAGRNAVVNGKATTIKSKDAPIIQKNAVFMGISLTSASGKPIFKYSSHDADNKPITVEVPMPTQWSNYVRDRVKLGNIIQNNFDNTEIMQMVKRDPTLIATAGQNSYAPRRTANGVRYAKLKTYNSSTLEYDRDGAGNLIYMPDEYMEQRLDRELSDLTDIITVQQDSK